MEKTSMDLSCFNLTDPSIVNSGSEKMEIRAVSSVLLTNEKAKYCKILFKADTENAGGYLVINEQHDIPVNSVSVMEIKTPVEIRVKLVVSAESEMRIRELSFEQLEEYEDLVKKCDPSNNVLVVTPSYPSSSNLYLCAFAHSRNREYKAAGVKLQVVSVSSSNWFETLYTIDGVSVYKGTFESIKRLLSTRRYKVTVTHFVDENLLSIYDGYTYPSDRMIFICHGPETVYRYLVNVTRPYFTKEIPDYTYSETFELKDFYIRKYAQKDNVEWIFVSDWLKEFSEVQQGIKFKHSRVINNIISEKLFPYKKKNAEQRKKILVIRKFDNISQHSIDQIVMAILELSERDYFDQLEFEIYGDGVYYDVLTAPIRQFKNIHFHRRFIPNSLISEVHEKAGVLLIPSRHDAHAVAMGEGASSGLVVVGSSVTSNPYFMQQERFHTLANPEDPVELANIIERLYRHPDEFLDISRQLSKFTRENFCADNTVKKEIKLIEEKMKEFDGELFPFKVKAEEHPVLSIVVPAYNVQQYIEKCAVSLMNHRNCHKTEVIIVNDGSKDNTSQIAHSLAEKSCGIIKVIDKKNGGHGSTINEGIKAAKGRYFRLVDGGDWVDGENLATLVDKLETEEADIVLTKGSYEYVEKSLLENIIDYGMMREGILYRFDILAYEGYGFNTYGPMLTTATIKTKVLKKADFRITEKNPYVDMEFNAFSLKYVDTIKYYDLDIYRSLIGRTEQTVSCEARRKKYKDHAEIIFNIITTLENDTEFQQLKKKYVYEHLITQMVDSQILMYDVELEWSEIDSFLERLKKYPEVCEKAIAYIERKQENSQLILRKYEHYKDNQSEAHETINDDPNLMSGSNGRVFMRRIVKKAVKCILPYGIVKIIIQKRNEGK